MMSDFYVGLMSGTSLDGVDGVLVDLSDARVRLLACASVPFDARFRQELLALNSPSFNELHRAALAGNRIAAVYAEAVANLLEQVAACGIDKAQIRAIGAHGQTVRHQPTGNAATAYTWQLNNPALLAELAGIDVVADFRSRDLAAGGQGAPLVPAFHRHVFSQPGSAVAVLNLGGIANLSVLPANPMAPVVGFDCGPGNALIDAWCQRHTGAAFDRDGAWAAGGQCLPDLLQQLQDDPYFEQAPPKSTGRDLFSIAWLDQKLMPFAAAQPQDIQNTLTELTASACAASVVSYSNNSKCLIVCGGGAYNLYLLQRLRARLPMLQVSTSDQHGLAPLQVEATAFAWLARQTIWRLPGNLPSVTGAAGARILGAIYPA
ncbi:MAG: anhydro-N-acetylmuramic acid kinase [Rhodoferax sp.]|nr:anhydro-N-acetylmuramic acid kinase [Rhodoferax sp.]